MKNLNEVKNTIIEIIRRNITLKTNEIMFLPEIRQHNLMASTLLVLIDEVRKEVTK